MDVSAGQTPLTLWGAALSAAIAVVAASSYLTKYFRRQKRRSQLAARAAACRETRDRKRDMLQKLLMKVYMEVKMTLARAREIASQPAHVLAAGMRDGKYGHVEVTLVFSLRAQNAGREFNSVTEEFYDEALDTAASLATRSDGAAPARSDDPAALVRTGRLLEGVPVSIKDCVSMRGADSTMGLAARCQQPSAEDSLFVELLRRQGAIPFVRGNVPQALMLPETDNNVWGTSLNPWNPLRTTGGSSGGDAALVALRAAPIAIGTDIGGSIRIPAHNCGVFGLKPTPQRFTHHGKLAPRPGNVDGQQLIKSAAGPLATCVEDLALVMRAWLVPEMWRRDPTVPPVPFSEAMYAGGVKTSAAAAELLGAPADAAADASGADSSTSAPTRLRIGYYVHDGYAAAAPTAGRAVRDAVAALERAGHECVPWVPPRVDDAARLYLALMSADGGMAGFKSGLDGEALHPAYRQVLAMAEMPGPVRSIATAAMTLLGERRTATILPAVRPKTAREHWADVVEFVLYCQAFNAAWADARLDAVVCPGNVLPAVAHMQSEHILPLFTHTFLWNMVHYPVGTVPVAVVADDEQDYFAAEGPCVRDRFSKFAHAALQGSAGLPFAVQVAALPFHDELVLRVMRELERDGIGRAGVPPAANL